MTETKAELLENGIGFRRYRVGENVFHIAVGRGWRVSLVRDGIHFPCYGVRVNHQLTVYKREQDLASRLHLIDVKKVIGDELEESHRRACEAEEKAKVLRQRADAIADLLKEMA